MTHIELTDATFEKEVNSTDKFVLVDFFAVWCGPCQTLGPILERIGKHFEEKIVVMKANLDSAQVTAQKFGVEKIPTIILFKNGKPVNGFVGLIPENEIKKWLENIINK